MRASAPDAIVKDDVWLLCDFGAWPAGEALVAQRWRGSGFANDVGRY